MSPANASFGAGPMPDPAVSVIDPPGLVLDPMVLVLHPGNINLFVRRLLDNKEKDSVNTLAAGVLDYIHDFEPASSVGELFLVIISDINDHILNCI